MSQPDTRKTDEQRQAIEELRAVGLSQDAIAGRLNISRSRVRWVLAARPAVAKPVEDLPSLSDFPSRRARLLDLWLTVAERGVVAAAASLEPKSTLAAAIAVDKVMKLAPAEGLELSELEVWLMSRRAPPEQMAEYRAGTSEPNHDLED